LTSTWSLFSFQSVFGIVSLYIFLSVFNVDSVPVLLPFLVLSILLVVVVVAVVVVAAVPVWDWRSTYLVAVWAVEHSSLMESCSRYSREV